MTEFLLDANVAYITLVLGFLLAVLALITPGTTLLELGAVGALLLAGWQIYHLPVHWWALALLLLGGGAFVLALGKSRPLLFLGAANLALIVGSAFIFRGERWYQPAVNPILALAVSALVTGFLWVAARKALEARNKLPRHALEALLGAEGEAKTAIYQEGSVQAAGELWSARSQQPIPAGARVRIKSREGFILEVEEIKSVS
jgi:membrane-bound serine protease (ClpP class)